MTPVTEYFFAICSDRVLFYDEPAARMPSLRAAERHAEALARRLGASKPALRGCSVRVLNREGRRLFDFPIWDSPVQQDPPRLGLPAALAYLQGEKAPKRE